MPRLKNTNVFLLLAMKVNQGCFPVNGGTIRLTKQSETPNYTETKCVIICVTQLGHHVI